MSQLQDVSIPVNELSGMTYISSWILTTIDKKRSTYSESSLLQVSSNQSICLMSGHAFHNAYKGEDQNIDLSYGQLNHSGGMSNFELMWMKMNSH